MCEYLIIGSGHQGLTMAAYLSMFGEKVVIWNRTWEHIKEISQTHTIYVNGIICGKAENIRVVKELKSPLPKVILITTPASSHRDIAKLLAPLVSTENIIVLNPGRTLGVLEFKKILLQEGCSQIPIMAETQSIVFTCRRETKDSVRIYALKGNVSIAAIEQENTDKVLQAMPLCIRSKFKAASSVLETSLGNVGMILHCAPVLMNIGWIESEKVDFKYYYDGISPSISKFIEKIDQERLHVARVFGVQIESVEEWMKRTYNAAGNGIYQCIQNNRYYREIDAPGSIQHRYLLEDIPCGLVPLESMGKAKGILTPASSLVIDLANAILQKDFREYGRNADLMEYVK